MATSQLAVPDTTQPQTAPEPLVHPHRQEPSHEEISTLAYAYWLQRGSEDGSAEDDWLRAEAELRESARPADPAI